MVRFRRRGELDPEPVEGTLNAWHYDPSFALVDYRKVLMGHHLFVDGSAVLAMKDSSLELVRHFLIEGAKDLGLNEVVEALHLWEWQGPGVWINVETELLARNPSVFDSAVRAACLLGHQVGVEYLNTKLQKFGTRWLGPREVRGIVNDLNRLREHLLAGA